MPGKAKDAPITTRTARAKLKPRKAPYFRQFEGTVNLGYFRPATQGRPGSWIARRRRADGSYETAALGAADDTPGIDANGTAILDFGQAQSALRAWARARVEAERVEAAGAAPTVRKAVEDYIATRERRSARGGSDARLRLTRHVLTAPLADVPLHLLSDRHLADWRARLTRGGRAPKDAPVREMAPATLARLLNDLRAALNAAGVKHRLALAPVVKSGLQAPEDADVPREIQLLTDPDVRRVVDAARNVDPDFGLLVMVMAATGARFDQLARATVADFQPDHARLMVPVSRKGRGDKTKKKPAQPIPLPADAVAALRAAVAGRRGAEPLLTRWHNRKVSPSAANGFMTWVRDGRRGWKDSSEITRPWRTALAEAGLPASFVPYALRHSSIVRALKVGVPVRIVAAAHDTSIAMIEKHYAAHIVDASEEIMRRALLPMSGAEVVSLAEARGR